MAFTKELEGNEERGQYARIDQAIGALRDEVSAINFDQSHGQNRLLSLVVAKLDEAQGLAMLAGVTFGRLVIVDRREILRGLTDTTDTTVAEGSEVRDV